MHRNHFCVVSIRSSEHQNSAGVAGLWQGRVEAFFEDNLPLFVFVLGCCFVVILLLFVVVVFFCAVVFFVAVLFLLSLPI
jgi:hypothetical protein